MRRTWAVAGAIAVLAAACRPDTVRVAFRPPVGAHYRYELRVRSVTTTRLGGGAPDRVVDAPVLRAEQTVLEGGPGEARVRVVLDRPGSPPRTFVVRFDRSAQLAGVDSIEGLPPSAVGRLGLPEIFPAATGTPPGRPLSPGQRWRIGGDVHLPDAAPSRLEGSGRLVELAVVNGRKVARIRSQTRLPLSSTIPAGDKGKLTLDGTEITDSTATRDLADGSVRDASSTTRGSFRLAVFPPSGTGAAIPGSLDVEVRSQTRRLN